MKADTPVERLVNGIIKENPTFVLVLGMCPTLAVTTSAINGIGMGLTTTAILALSNLMISMLRNFIPDKVRIPAYIVVVASFVTIVQFLLEAYIPSLYASLGIYIPLIVVNCIILGRAEAYASKHKPVASLFDGIGMGLGFTLSITCIGAIRELIGAGQIFGFQLLPPTVWPDMNRLLFLCWLLEHSLFCLLWLLFRTNSSWVRRRDILIRVEAAAAARDAVPAATRHVPARKEIRHERITDYSDRLSPCQ